MKKKNIIIAIVAVLAVVALVLGILVKTHKIGPKAKEPVSTTKAPTSTTTTTKKPTTTTTTEAEEESTETTTKVPTKTTAPAKSTTTAAPAAQPATPAPAATTTTTTTTTKPSEDPDYNNVVFKFYDQDMLSAVNGERAKVGKNALKLDRKLNEIARTRAKELITLFSHTRPNGTNFSSAFSNKVTYTSCGENIAKGQTDIQMVMFDEQYGWMYSAGHRANILSETHDYNAMGYAWCVYQGVNYWVQEFAYIP